MRDGIVLNTLSQIVAGESKTYAVVALIVQTRPLFWHKKRKNGQTTECFEFFIRDDTTSLFKIKCWGEKAIRVSGRIKSHDIVLIDDFSVILGGGEAVGILSVDSEMQLLSSRCGSALFCRDRFNEIAARFDAIEPLRSTLR